MPAQVEKILREVRVRDLQVQRDHRVPPETPLGEVYRLLHERRHGAVLVCEEDRPIGLFTERDILYRTALEDLDPATPVRELMTSDPVTIDANRRLADAIRIMVERGYRHLPVVDDAGREAGLLSSRVVLKFIADHFPEAVLNLPPRLHQVMARPEGG